MRSKRKCKTCSSEVTGPLLHGQCPDCAGLVALPLRGERGRFMTFTPKPAPSSASSSGSAEVPAGGER
jgi:hypothetical protein